MFEYILLLIFVLVVIALIFIYRATFPSTSENVQPQINTENQISQSVGADPDVSPSTISNIGQPCTPKISPTTSVGAIGNREEAPLYLYVDSQGKVQLLVKSPVKTNSINTLPRLTAGFLTATATTVPLKNIQVPATFDSRQKWPGRITNPLNQVDCGSCWSFATSTTFSDRYRIKNPNTANASSAVKQLYQTFCYLPSERVPSPSYVSMNNVSPYQVVRCDKCPPGVTDPADCQQGCAGGVIAEALNYLVATGANSILAVQSKPLNPNLALTPCTLITNQPTTIPVYKGTKLLRLSEETPQGGLTLPPPDLITRIKEQIFENGPVAAGFTVFGDFRNYTSGVYNGGSGGIDGGHAIVIVGWGVENNQEYWIVRNSWGLNWGIGGYFNIAIDWKPPVTRDNNNNIIPTMGILDEVWAIEV